MKKNVILLITGLILATSVLAALYYLKSDNDFSGLGNIYQERRAGWEKQQKRAQLLDQSRNPPLSETAALPSFRFKMATTLSDRSYLAVELELKFRDAGGVQEARKKFERMNYAFYMSFSSHTASGLDNGSNRKVLGVVESILNKYIKNEIAYVYIIDYVLKPNPAIRNSPTP